MTNPLDIIAAHINQYVVGRKVVSVESVHENRFHYKMNFEDGSLIIDTTGSLKDNVPVLVWLDKSGRVVGPNASN